MKFRVFIFLFVLVSCPSLLKAHSLKAESPQAEENKDELPITLKQAVEEFIANLDEEKKKRIKETKYCSLLFDFHMLDKEVIFYGVWNHLNNNDLLFRPMTTRECLETWMQKDSSISESTP